VEAYLPQLGRAIWQGHLELDGTDTATVLDGVTTHGGLGLLARSRLARTKEARPRTCSWPGTEVRRETSWTGWQKPRAVDSAPWSALDGMARPCVQHGKQRARVKIARPSGVVGTWLRPARSAAACSSAWHSSGRQRDDRLSRAPTSTSAYGDRAHLANGRNRALHEL
jgi:hypothetical protein